MPEHISTFLICSDDGGLNHRYGVRVSTFVQLDENLGRRSTNGLPSREDAEEIAKKIARSGTRADDP